VVSLPAGRQEERRVGVPSALQVITDALIDLQGGVKAEGWRGCAQPEITISLGEEKQMISSVPSAAS